MITELYEYDSDRMEKENIAEKKQNEIEQVILPLWRRGATFGAVSKNE